jgi:hypothetical protein
LQPEVQDIMRNPFDVMIFAHKSLVCPQNPLPVFALRSERADAPKNLRGPEMNQESKPGVAAKTLVRTGVLASNHRCCPLKTKVKDGALNDY